MDIISGIMKKFPPPPNTYINLYRDFDAKQAMPYGLLSQRIKDLGVKDGQTIYFKAGPYAIF